MLLPVTNDAYRLIHEGCLALAQVEQVGARIDVRYLKHEIERTADRVRELRSKIYGSNVWKLWKKRYGSDANMGSREQLANILFRDMKIRCTVFTKTGRPSANKESLESTNLEFVHDYLEFQQMIKIGSTYLKGILREVDPDGFLHPFFDLHTARSYRSSSSQPNFQNIPKRDKRLMAIVRRAFIPRKGNQLIEADYSGAEIASATCYHKDPRMIKYIVSPAYDMHWDMARACYLLADEDRNSDIRHCGKNMFVFPQFFGDYYLNNAVAMWEAIGDMGLKTHDGISLYEHLKRNGIEDRGACVPGESPTKGTFEEHLKKVQEFFWEELFPTYTKWKIQWYDSYAKTGRFDTLTGFRFEGLMDRKKVINYPIQGTAFHWLLWSLTEAVLRRISKLRGTHIIGQIHDSIIGDVHPSEFENYRELMTSIMTKEIVKHWPWIIVPLTVDFDVCPVNEPWSEKQKAA